MLERKGAEQTQEMKDKLDELHLQFMRIDEDGSGCISASELSHAMNALNMGVT